MPYRRLAVLNFLFLITLVSGAVLYGRISAKPNKLQQLGFDVCDGRPCFMGLTLGTPWANARAMLAKRKELIDNSDDLNILRIQNIDIGVRPDHSQTQVDDVDFNFWADNDLEISVADIFALFGPPCSVSIILIEDYQIEWIVINYPEIHFTTNGIAPDAMMTALVLSKSSDVSYCASKKIDSFRSNPWKGFRGLSYYLVDRSLEK